MNPEAEFKYWEKMKTLYLESEEKEDELLIVAYVELTERSGEKGGASTSAPRRGGG